MDPPGIKRGLSFLWSWGHVAGGEGILRCQAGLQEAVRKGTLENGFNLEAATAYTPCKAHCTRAATQALTSSWSPARAAV